MPFEVVAEIASRPICLLIPPSRSVQWRSSQEPAITRVSRQFKVDHLRSNLVKFHNYIFVSFNVFELSTSNFQLFEFPTLNCCRTNNKYLEALSPSR